MRDMDALPTWVNGRTILIGDAAHPSTFMCTTVVLPTVSTDNMSLVLPHLGQGAAHGIEDAEALGAFLRGVDNSGAPAALHRVFRARYRRVTRAQAASRAGGMSKCVISFSRLVEVKADREVSVEHKHRTGATLDPAAALRDIVASWSYEGVEKWEKDKPEEVLSEKEEEALLKS
jgi:2-polyprenyl-6-methoxyphenol hydroxylase-like FAD-dependent oxidoreductase